MSEYQYYEFRTIDRPLTEEEMRKLRSYSTRARMPGASLEKSKLFCSGCLFSCTGAKRGVFGA